MATNLYDVLDELVERPRLRRRTKTFFRTSNGADVGIDVINEAYVALYIDGWMFDAEALEETAELLLAIADVLNGGEDDEDDEDEDDDDEYDPYDMATAFFARFGA